MACFQYKSESEIARATRVAKLNLESSWSDKSGCETWSCAFAPDDSYFAWSCGNRKVVLVPWNSNKCCPVKSGKDDNTTNTSEITIDCGYLVWAVAFASLKCTHQCPQPHSAPQWTGVQSSGDLILATGLATSRIRIWEVLTGKLLMELVDHKDVIRDLSFAPDHSLRLVSASRDMTLKVWELRNDGNMVKTLRGHMKWVFACKWSPDAKYVASVGSGKQVLVWKMDDYSLYKQLEGHQHDVVSCDFSADGALLATASWDTKVLVWDHVTGQLLKQLCHVHPPPRPIYASGVNGSWVRGVAFSHDNCHIASIADDGYVRVWNMLADEDPVEVAIVDNALCCGFSSSGGTLAVGTRNGSVSFFAVPKEIPSLQHMSRVAVRRQFTSVDVNKWILPKIVNDYLRYKTFE
ncbi:WD repeat and SOCS box-containing protein 1 [Chamberlinius hualienensis]